MDFHYGRAVASGFLLGVFTIVGCASAFQFHWPYYNAKLPAREITQADIGKDLGGLCYDEGILLGKLGADGWPDLPFAECKPDPIPSPGVSPAPSPVLMKCGTFRLSDVHAVIADDEKCHSDLSACQQGPPPTPKP